MKFQDFRRTANQYAWLFGDHTTHIAWGPVRAAQESFDVIQRRKKKKINQQIMPTLGLSSVFLFGRFMTKTTHFPTPYGILFSWRTKTFLHHGFWELGNKIWHGCRSWQCEKKLSADHFIFSSFFVRHGQGRPKKPKNRKITPKSPICFWQLHLMPKKKCFPTLKITMVQSFEANMKPLVAGTSSYENTLNYSSAGMLYDCLLYTSPSPRD